MTNFYFATSNNDIVNRITFGGWDWNTKPLNILCAFEPKNGFRGWTGRTYQTPGVKTILDSGAFSAWKSGTKVNVDELIEEAKRPGWHEVAAFDPIGDPDSSLANALKMRNAGLPVIPIFHFGESWDFLEYYKSSFGDRIGLGGIATGISAIERKRWLDQVFARAYPAKFHGFGVASEDLLMRFPFYSVDSASWHTGLRYGRSAALPDLKMPRKSTLDGSEHQESAYDMRFELNHYLDLEAKVKDRWAQELAWAH